MKILVNYPVKIILFLSIITQFSIAGDTLEGTWIRIDGGSKKEMIIKDNIGSFNVKWMNTYQYIKDIQSNGKNLWSCKMIHNKGPELFWKTCQIERTTDHRIIISDPYAKHTFKKY